MQINDEGVASFQNVFVIMRMSILFCNLFDKRQTLKVATTIFGRFPRDSTNVYIVGQCHLAPYCISDAYLLTAPFLPLQSQVPLGLLQSFNLQANPHVAPQFTVSILAFLL